MTKKEQAKQELETLLKASVLERTIALLREKEKNETGKSFFTPAQINTLKKSFKDTKQVEEANHYMSLYNALLLYAKAIIGYRQTYKAEVNKLIGLIDLYNAEIETSLSIIKDFKEKMFEGQEFVIFRGKYLELYVYPDLSYKLSDDTQLFPQLQEQSEEVKKALSKVKCYVEALRLFILNSIPQVEKLLPEGVDEMLIAPDYLKEEKGREKYFKKYLNKEIKEDKKPTEEALKWALFPDYKDIPLDDEGFKSADNHLNIFLTLWNIER